MLYAASTASWIALVAKSEVEAWPRRRPRYTVTERPLSRVCSIVSTFILRVLTERPTDSLTSAAASDAPLSRARESAASARPRSASEEKENSADIQATGWGKRSGRYDSRR